VTGTVTRALETREMLREPARGPAGYSHPSYLCRRPPNLNFIFRTGRLRASDRESLRVIICHCRAVNDRAIREVVRSGASTCREVARACHAGRICGGCRPAIAALIDEERAQVATIASREGIAAAAS